MKYRVEFSVTSGGGPQWQTYGTFATKEVAQKVARHIERGQFRRTRTRILPAPDSAETTPVPEGL